MPDSKPWCPVPEWHFQFVFLSAQPSVPCVGYGQTSARITLLFSLSLLGSVVFALCRERVWAEVATAGREAGLHRRMFFTVTRFRAWLLLREIVIVRDWRTHRT